MSGSKMGRKWRSRAGSPLRGAPNLPRHFRKVKPRFERGFSGPWGVRRGVALTCSRALGYLSGLVSKRTKKMDWAVNEADIQSAQSQARKQARVPLQNEDSGWSTRAQSPTQTRSRPVGGDDRREVTTTQKHGEGLPRSARIRRSTEIRALLERGKRKRTTSVDVFFMSSPASFSRLGVIVPKHGRRIVERNRLKRRLREIGRRSVLPHMDEKSCEGDVLIRARRRAYAATFEELAREVNEAVEAFCSEES